MTSRRRKLSILVLLVIAAISGTFLAEPIPQDPEYHRFADRRNMAGVPNCNDVLSNLPFLVVGVLGVLGASRLQTGRWAWIVLFSGVLGTAFGSAWYHLDPRNETLLWDRLPMTLGFMGLVTVVIGEQVSRRAGRAMLVPLVLAGVSSVIWWHVTESQGRGDLRWYALVQILPLLVLPLVALMFPGGMPGLAVLGLALGFYLLAKVLESFDHEIFEALRILSGHTLKHLAAGVAAFCLYLALRIRVACPESLRSPSDSAGAGAAGAGARSSG